MSERLSDVLMNHQPQPSLLRGVEDCSCGDGAVGEPGWFLQHQESVVIAHLRAVAADEGVRERVGRALWTAMLSSASQDEPVDAVLTAFLDALGRAAGEGK